MHQHQVQNDQIQWEHVAKQDEDLIEQANELEDDATLSCLLGVSDLEAAFESTLTVDQSVDVAKAEAHDHDETCEQEDQTDSHSKRLQHGDHTSQKS